MQNKRIGCRDLRLFKLTNGDMKKKRSTDKRKTFHRYQFLFGYLIFDFRPTQFSHFQKITTYSYSHNGEKNWWIQMDPSP